MNDDVSEPNIQCVLTDDQLLWFNTFGTINLNQWRCLYLNGQMEWYYIGNWCNKVAEINSLKSINKEFKIRDENLMLDRYYYWPDEIVSFDDD